MPNIIMCVKRFRPAGLKSNKFFVCFGSGKEIINPTKELDNLQREFNLPSICSSNARPVIETLKGTSGLGASSSAGIICLHAML